MRNDDSDGEESETGPQRRCLATGRVGSVEQMIRFVVGPEQQLVPDIEARLPGRGMWLSARRDVVNSAVAKSLFSKAARQKLAVPPDLVDRLEALLRRRCLELLGLARRAGQAVSGYDKVRAELKSGRGALLLAACDGAKDGIGKIRALAPHLPLVTVFSGGELGLSFGRDHTVHGLLLPGKLAERLQCEAERLSGILGGSPEHNEEENSVAPTTSFSIERE